MTGLERLGLWAAVAGTVIVIGLLSSINGEYRGHEKAMTEAFERGLAAECPGAVGYYWECE